MFKLGEAFKLVTGQVTKTDLAIKRVEDLVGQQGKTLSAAGETQIRSGLLDGNVTVGKDGSVHVKVYGAGRRPIFMKTELTEPTEKVAHRDLYPDMLDSSDKY